MKSKYDDIVCKTVKMPRYRLEHLKHISYMKGMTTMSLINDVLQQFIEDNEALIQSYNELFDEGC